MGLNIINNSFNGYFMKIENRNSDMNAVNLTNAKLYNIRNDKLLQVIKIDLIV